MKDGIHNPKVEAACISLSVCRHSPIMGLPGGTYDDNLVYQVLAVLEVV